ncbi:MAG: hypothetical protein JWL77_4053 [Chthonomonadaceae bacterium]|nr:hypothetical protein [Chthonomonadaceae bacterium]
MSSEDSRKPLNREQARKMVKQAMAEPKVWTPECYDPDEIIDVVRRGATYPRGAEIMIHMAECAYCRDLYMETSRTLAEVEALRSMPVQAQNPRKQRLVLAYSLSLAAACLALLFFLGPGRRWWAGTKPPIVVVTHFDDPKFVQGQPFEGGHPLPSFAAADVRAFISQPGQLRNATTGTLPVVQLLSPRPGNAALVDLPDVFRWASVPGNRYDVKLQAEVTQGSGYKEVPGSQVTEATAVAFRPSHKLDGDVTYHLTIRILNGVGPALDAPPTTYRFRVLTPSEAEKARWALAHRKEAPVTSAVTLFRLGLFQDAMETTSSWGKGSSLQKQWATAIRQALELRMSSPSTLDPSAGPTG